MNKVNEKVDEMLNPPKSNIPVVSPSKPQAPVAGKIAKKVLSKKPPKLGLSIKDISGKSNKQIVQKVLVPLFLNVAKLLVFSFKFSRK